MHPSLAVGSLHCFYCLKHSYGCGCGKARQGRTALGKLGASTPSTGSCTSGSNSRSYKLQVLLKPGPGHVEVIMPVLTCCPAERVHAVRGEVCGHREVRGGR